MPRQRLLLAAILLLLAALVSAAAEAESDDVTIEVGMEDDEAGKKEHFMTIDRYEQPAGWERLEGEMHQIVGKGPHVWGINYRGGTYRWKGRGWEGDALSPPLRQVAVGWDGHRWGLTPDGRVFRHNGRKWEELPEAPQLEYLDASDYSHAVGIVMDEDQAYYFDGIRWYPLGVMGKSISIGPNQEMWLVTNEGAALRYTGKWPGGHFEMVAQPAESAIHSLQVCDGERITITTDKEELMTWNSRGGWTQFPGRGRWFINTHDHAFALGSDGSIWRYLPDGGKRPRRPRKEDTETEEGDQAFEADKFEEKMIV